MPERRKLVCLANSVKLKHFCVAGVDPDTLAWVRPVGAGPHGAILREEQALKDGSIAELLDVVEVPLGDPVPALGQPENYSIAPGQWKRVASLDRGEAQRLLDALVTDEPLFGNRGKAVPASVVEEEGVVDSLAVIRPDQTTWRKDDKGRLSAVFHHADRELELKVTDPAWTAQFDDDELGDYEFEDAGSTYLVVSLAEEHNGWHTKLVAGVIALDP